MKTPTLRKVETHARIGAIDTENDLQDMCDGYEDTIFETG
jgi:hypothetical protein